MAFKINMAFKKNIDIVFEKLKAQIEVHLSNFLINSEPRDKIVTFSSNSLVITLSIRGKTKGRNRRFKLKPQNYTFKMNWILNPLKFDGGPINVEINTRNLHFCLLKKALILHKFSSSDLEYESSKLKIESLLFRDSIKEALVLEDKDTLYFNNLFKGVIKPGDNMYELTPIIIDAIPTALSELDIEKKTTKFNNFVPQIAKKQTFNDILQERSLNPFSSLSNNITVQDYNQFLQRSVENMCNVIYINLLGKTSQQITMFLIAADTLEKEKKWFEIDIFKASIDSKKNITFI